MSRKLCGVKFCGGCNPRYDRMAVFMRVKDDLRDRLDFQFARETDNEGRAVEYDLLLVIGGCGSCCASVEPYRVRGPVVRIWDEAQIGEQIARLREAE